MCASLLIVVMLQINPTYIFHPQSRIDVKSEGRFCCTDKEMQDLLSELSEYVVYECCIQRWPKIKLM